MISRQSCFLGCAQDWLKDTEGVFVRRKFVHMGRCLTMDELERYEPRMVSPRVLTVRPTSHSVEVPAADGWRYRLAH
jgi:hypothetical protein